MTDLDIASVVHDANRAYCITQGDYSQLPWMECPEWQKTSAMNGVAAIRSNPSTTPEQSHEGWMAEKLANGWKYGESKDADAKTHPCIVPYNELPEFQRTKDHLFGAIVRILLNN